MILPPDGTIDIVGRLVEASNATFLCQVRDAAGDELCHVVYKPTAGEAPLWDFADGTLGHREVAAYVLSAAAGFDVVPETEWAEAGPLGAGSLQRWLEQDGEELVTLLPRRSMPDGWFPVVRGVDERERPVVLAHADDDRLRRLALFDVLANNADRKGAHIISHAGGVYGVDHGVCFHSEPKLRTVLWGWAGAPLTDAEAALVQAALDEAELLEEWLTLHEVDAFRGRCRRVLRAEAFPEPGDRWPVIPWPPL